jgi:hypothetical protein
MSERERGVPLQYATHNRQPATISLRRAKPSVPRLSKRPGSVGPGATILGWRPMDVSTPRARTWPFDQDEPAITEPFGPMKDGLRARNHLPQFC